MGKIAWSLVFTLLLFVSLGCDEQKDCCTNDEGDGLIGSWLLYERGYSPGAGYITEAISSNPRQEVSFRADNGFTSTVNGFEDYKFYKVLEDTVGHTQFVALFVNDPDTLADPLAGRPPTYSFDRNGDTLKLYFRFCIEGCHLAFKKSDGD